MPTVSGQWHLVEAIFWIGNAPQGVLPLLRYTILYYWDWVCDIVYIGIQVSMINHRPLFAPGLGTTKVLALHRRLPSAFSIIPISENF